jgi:hypothetical protein
LESMQVSIKRGKVLLSGGIMGYLKIGHFLHYSSQCLPCLMKDQVRSENSLSHCIYDLFSYSSINAVPLSQYLSHFLTTIALSKGRATARYITLTKCNRPCFI